MWPRGLELQPVPLGAEQETHELLNSPCHFVGNALQGYKPWLMWPPLSELATTTLALLLEWKA